MGRFPRTTIVSAVMVLISGMTSLSGQVRWRAVLDAARIEEIAGKPFQSIVSLVVCQSGFVYAADRMISSVGRLSPDGSDARWIGRHGRGPGEFQFLHAARCLGDTLVTIDPHLRRFTF